jgi:AcrR family transcriptional regulator
MSRQSADLPAKRPYEKRRRAAAERETRRRITAAAVELHGSVGPARTTVSELAKRAGVQRATVYRHFPDEAGLFEACSARWAESHPPPDPAAWMAIDKPKRRLRTALRELYAFYRENEAMLANLMRDMPAMSELAAATEARQAAMAERAGLLADGWKKGDPRLRAAAIGLALEFRTWQMLVREQGLDDERAVELMVHAAAT